MDSNKRPEDMERITTPELASAFIDEQVEAVRAQVGDQKVLLALSGGVDSVSYTHLDVYKRQRSSCPKALQHSMATTRPAHSRTRSRASRSRPPITRRPPKSWRRWLQASKASPST